MDNNLYALETLVAINGWPRRVPRPVASISWRWPGRRVRPCAGGSALP